MKKKYHGKDMPMMYYKLVGSGMILASTAWAGFHAALRLRRTQEELREVPGVGEVKLERYGQVFLDELAS